MIQPMRRLLFILLASALLPTAALAEEITIRPFLIDETLVPRESVTETIRLESSYDVRKSVIFATVNEITIGTDGEIKEFVSPVMTDRTNTVTSWVEIGRGRIEVLAGESTEVPLKVQAHPQAKPGEYHLFIGFVEAKNRPTAEKVALTGNADGVIVKITVDDERADSMRVARLAVDRFITNPKEQLVTVTLENPGEIASVPEGELVFYNNRGIEVAAAPVNDAGDAIAPGEERAFQVAVPFTNDLGRYKANLNLQYGKNQQASLYDSTSFFMMPWWYAVLFSLGLLTLAGLLTTLFRRMLVAHKPHEHGENVTMFVRDGHEADPLDHDIDLTDSTNT